MKIFNPKILGDIKLPHVDSLPEYEEKYKNTFFYVKPTCQIFYGGSLDWINLSALTFEAGYDQLKLFPSTFIDENIADDIYVDNINIYDYCKYKNDSIFLSPVIENQSDLLLTICNPEDSSQTYKDASIYNNYLPLIPNHYVYCLPFTSEKYITYENRTGLDMNGNSFKQIFPTLNFSLHSNFRCEFNVCCRSMTANSLFKIGNTTYTIELTIGGSDIILAHNSIKKLNGKSSSFSWTNIILIKNYTTFYLYVNGEFFNTYTLSNELTSNTSFYIMNSTVSIIVSDIRISKYSIFDLDQLIIPTTLDNIDENDLFALDFNKRQILKDLSPNKIYPYIRNSKLYFDGLSYLPVLYCDKFNLKKYDFTINCSIQIEEKLGLDGIDNISIDYSTPKATSNILPSPYIFSSSSNLTTNLAYYAFDQTSPNTYWAKLNNSIPPHNLMVDYGENNKKCINKYSICAPSDAYGGLIVTASGHILKNMWKFQASNNILASVTDGETDNDWITLHNVNFSGSVQPGQWTPYYTFKNYIKYQKYRLYNTSGYIGELKLVEDSNAYYFSPEYYILSCGDSTSNYAIGINEDKKLFFEVNNSRYLSDSELEYDQNYDLEIVRNNLSIYMFLNGNSIGINSVPNSLLISKNIFIGSKYDLTSKYLGYLNNFTIDPNIAKHISNFISKEETSKYIDIPNVDPNWLLATTFYPLEDGSVEDISIFKNYITNYKSSRHINFAYSGENSVAICSDPNVGNLALYLKNSYLTISDIVEDWDFGINNLTIECDINFPILDLNYEQSLISFGIDENNFFSLNYKLSTTSFVFRYFNSTLNINMQYEIPNLLLNINTWYNFALCRYNSILYFFLNGTMYNPTKIGLTSSSASISNAWVSPLIINHSFYSEFTQVGSIKLTNLLITKGYCKYISNYTVQRPVVSNKYTVFYLKYNEKTGKFIDSTSPISSNNSPDNLFYSGIVFDAPIYISPSRNWALGSSDFRIEFDCYYISGSDYSPIIDYGFSNSPDGWGVFVKPGTNSISFSIKTSNLLTETSFSTTSSTFMPNTWNRVTIVRIGSSLKIYINSVNKVSSTITRNVGSYDYNRRLCLGKSIYNNGTIKTAKFQITKLIISKGPRYNLSFVNYDYIPFNISFTPKSPMDVCNSKEFFIDHINKISELNYGIDTIIQTFGNLPGTSKWSNAVLCSDGSILSTQYDSSTILKLLFDNNFSLLPAIQSSIINKFSSSVLIPNNELCLIPSTFEYSGCYNIDSNISTYISSKLTGEKKWTSGIFAPDNFVYCAPFNSNAILKIDFNSSSPSSTQSGYISGSQKYMGSVFALDDCIYSIPFDSTSLLKIFINTPTLDSQYSVFNIPSPILGGWSGGVLAPDGCIYCIPYNSTSILKIIPGSNPTFSSFGNFSGTSKWSGGVLGPDGNIYCIPYDSTQILKITPGINPVATLLSTSLSGTSKWSGGILGFDGNIYGIPYNSTTILKISFPKLRRNFDINVLLSPYLNKF